MIAMMSLQDVVPESFEELWDPPGFRWVDPR